MRTNSEIANELFEKTLNCKLVPKDIENILEVKESEAKELYEALEMMYEQYCPEPFTHKYMTAGENAEEMLDKYSKYKKHPHHTEELLELENQK